MTTNCPHCQRVVFTIENPDGPGYVMDPHPPCLQRYINDAEAQAVALAIEITDLRRERDELWCLLDNIATLKIETMDDLATFPMRAREQTARRYGILMGVDDMGRFVRPERA